MKHDCTVTLPADDYGVRYSIHVEGHIEPGSDQWRLPNGNMEAGTGPSVLKIVDVIFARAECDLPAGGIVLPMRTSVMTFDLCDRLSEKLAKERADDIETAFLKHWQEVNAGERKD